MGGVRAARLVEPTDWFVTSRYHYETPAHRSSACCCWVRLAVTADAAMITIVAVDAVDEPNYDLTNVYGTADWAYWVQTADPLDGAGGAQQREVGGQLDRRHFGRQRNRSPGDDECHRAHL